MKMTPAKNICSLCNRSDVKLYGLKDSIRPPNHLHFEGHTNLRAVLEKILNTKEKNGKTTNEICQKCRERLHEIYSFTHQHTESEKIFHRITDATVRLRKLKSFSILTDFKIQFEDIAETDKDIHSLDTSSTTCDNSAVSGIVVKMECDNNLEDRIDFNKHMKDVNFGLLEGKYSKTADSGNVVQKKIDSMDSDDAEQITIQDEIIKEEWKMQEGYIFEANNANHDGLDRENKKIRSEIYDIPLPAGVEIKCNQCGAKCKTRRDLTDHKMAHNNGIFACNSSFSNKGSFTRHLREVYTDSVFSCDHCDSIYKSKSVLNQHKQTVHGILFNSNQCDEKLKNNDSLRHDKVTHPGAIFACNKCGSRFSNEANFTRHLREVHADSIFPCDHCDAAYRNKQTLNLHNKIVNGKLYNCNQCDAIFKTICSLRHHKMTHTRVTLACNKCDASFSNTQNLNQHLRCVHPNSVFSCDHCDAIYKTKYTLNRHKQIINGILFNCDQCDAKYRAKSSLRYHKMKFHTTSASS